jgi:hypothetical protein
MVGFRGKTEGLLTLQNGALGSFVGASGFFIGALGFFFNRLSAIFGQKIFPLNFWRQKS